MKSVSELTDFYYKNLFPTLQKLEKEREQLKHRIILVAVLFTTVTLFIALVLKNYYEFILFAYIAIGTIIYKILVHDYTHKFKTSIIKPLIHVIDNTLEYSLDLHVSESLFEHSKLFSKPDKLSGNDYVKGSIDGVNIEFSDIHAQKREKNSKGQDSWSTIFKGLFIAAEFNKHFYGQTVILPDTAQNTFGDIIGHWLQSNNGIRDELVKMDDVEFEKEFVVYSTDQIEARYILSHSLMKRVLLFKQKSKHPIHVSFVGTHIYMAIEYEKDLFEPSVFRSLLEYKIAMEYVQTLHLAIGIVEELKLNQKLWSKR
ncbi:MAG: Galanin [Sulfurimonas sp. RIFOXYD12_FULL_33_39]|uniref:DUF3137 domain-containing protein n=1 Tax=unclassified Sulfurimonas TaxID=2623549 RepID=UPI0008C953B4|nr:MULTISPECIES: DUF3137 domain-containing protein [unclassified Sulfurimonas]OHE03196.1 MAG: Galanin [Sulfurimonas sp. RIFCSPLOWO2_12_FULL_34_6]OHE08987.1 MAG: Galanin [Sulfurimonas sp. RIFOXYD12_FULL_33_39]OHE14297.1 MAG: Galanin [Sulfurimonas sp. RIFOXYD2_FULL_34_21]DAB28133.1 MAG TPA: Galanin [Sulfurimonas sp. UBA10385]